MKSKRSRRQRPERPLDLALLAKFGKAQELLPENAVLVTHRDFVGAKVCEGLEAFFGTTNHIRASTRLKN
jgi:hypothetical protein